MKIILKKYIKVIIGIALSMTLGAIGFWAYISYQNSRIVHKNNTDGTEQVEASYADTANTTQSINTTTEKPTEQNTFRITNIDRGSTLTGVEPIKVFVPTGGYTLSVTINSDKWGEIFSTLKEGVSGEVSIAYSFNQTVALNQSGNVRAVLFKNGVEVDRNEIWINF